MRIQVGAGTYVVAVSGGVDSMVLLDLLRERPGLNLVVAHYDHGIRSDSHKDRKLVQDITKKHGLTFVQEQGKLGPGASEAKARAARYAFLSKVKKASGSRAIITAHHQDDVLETAIINLLRGGGRRGLTSLKSTDGIRRPLLEFSKPQLREYAEDHALLWHEDETNQDINHLRNYIRHKVLPKFSEAQRAQLVILLENLQGTNKELDEHIIGLLHVQPALNELDRSWFIALPHGVAKEILHAWFTRHEIRDVNRKMIDRLVIAAKTGKAGHYLDVDHKHRIHIKKNVLALEPRER